MLLRACRRCAGILYVAVFDQVHRLLWVVTSMSLNVYASYMVFMSVLLQRWVIRYYARR
ncbi:hypothetical protein NEOLEDRAFT_1139972 [Neolentinus lepideus HHB14362 ss-1]|uniref:Uncharacterized protein n=1 Tax=Neolentinus lepideus HHB14362 ss-1 TaxID=1314782 RepID=A0A165PJC2_9AGAM|nr:hypothetical protein NEOLEDRAFT_1139972 [Neolentinus lepideus HHB14362 ss-1]